MQRLVEQSSDVFAFKATGWPPEQYEVQLQVAGLARGLAGRPIMRTAHRFDAYLHLDYPRQAPLLQWRTPVFHPNILPPSRNGGVCIGAWSPSESLADLCRRIARMVSYESFSVGDALDPEAASWAVNTELAEGADLRAFLQTA
jgi:ubiquitin-protein ligase